MGGLGSGLWHRPSRRRKIEETICLDMTVLRNRLIVIHQNGGGDKIDWRDVNTGEHLMRLWIWSYANDASNRCIRVEHRDEKGIIDCEWRIPITITPMHLGSMRFLFVCPICKVQHCRKIYLLNSKFGCRVCHGLVHDSSQKGKERRLWHQYHKMNDKLGGDGDLSCGVIPTKPKGMHKTSFNKKRKHLERYYKQAKDRMNAVAMPTVMRHQIKMYQYNHLFDDELKIKLD